MVSMLLAFISLPAGIVGYMHFENLAWRDVFLIAAMLLGGMGPANAPVTDDGKLFAGIHALHAGLVFLIVAGVILAPILHRLLYLFHWEEKQDLPVSPINALSQVSPGQQQHNDQQCRP